MVAGLRGIIGDWDTRKPSAQTEQGSIWPAYECLERLAVVAPLWLRGRVRLLIPAVAQTSGMPRTERQAAGVGVRIPFDDRPLRDGLDGPGSP